MLNFAIHNEAIQGGIPIPLLTNQPPFVEVGIMAKSSIAEKKRRKQYKTRTPIRKGMKFGRLTVVKEIEPYITPKGKKDRKVKLLCDCGNVTKVLWRSLTRERTRSCGCLQKEIAAHSKTVHGGFNHPLYKTWSNMIQRCTNPNHNSFKDYGGRGICVAPEWANDFEVFYEWAIDNGWEKGLVLDREENNGAYEPGNARFVDYGLSNRNRRLLTSRNTSKYGGVYYDKTREKWGAAIMSDGKAYRLGRFSTAEEAAKVRDAKARELDAGHPLNFQS